MIITGLALAGCGAEPGVTGLSASRIVPGDALVVHANGLPEHVFVALRNGDAVTTLDGAQVRDAAVHVQIPEDQRPGTYQVEVIAGGDVWPGTALQVLDVPAERVCAAGWTVNTTVALASGRIRIDRFDDTGGHTPIEVARDDVAGVEFETVEVSDGVCEVVWLRLQSGWREAYDVRQDGVLEARGRRLASDLGVPFEVTREAVVADAEDPRDAASE